MYSFIKRHEDSEEYRFVDSDYDRVKQELNEHLEDDLKAYSALLVKDDERIKELIYMDGENGVWMKEFHIYYEITELE